MSQGGPNAPARRTRDNGLSRVLAERPRLDAAASSPRRRKWLVIGHFPTKRLAQEAAKAFVAAAYGPAEDFRVQRTKAPAD